MASELKPCPFCGSNQLSFRSTPDMDTDGKYHRISCNECGASSRATFAMDACPLFYEELSKAWNTRPTPVDANPLASNPVDDKIAPDTDGNGLAATDTGLVTVAWESMDNKLDPNDKLVYEVKFPRNGDKRLVYKSQAEELLAAERARYVEASQRATNEESLKDTMHRGLLRWKERAEYAEQRLGQSEAELKQVRADNAALTAKLDTANALVTCCCGDPVDAHNMGSCHSPVDQYHYAFMQLEAKLAAAEKALEGLREKGRKVLDVLKAWEDDGDLVNSGKIVSDFRAVLGGKPS